MKWQRRPRDEWAHDGLYVLFDEGKIFTIRNRGIRPIRYIVFSKEDWDECDPGTEPGGDEEDDHHRVLFNLWTIDCQ